MADAPQMTTHPAETAVAALASELATARAERDDYRARFLRMMDLNDKLRAALAHDASRVQALEAMCRG